MQPVSMTEKKIHWLNTAFLTVTPVAAVILVPIYYAQAGFSWAPLIAMSVLWWATGLGITAGYHRLFSHKSYKATWPVRLAYAILGGAAWQNSAIVWCSDHRIHHREVDTDLDPYNAQRGFWWSHMGWVMVEDSGERDFANVRDLLKDPICAWQHKYYMPITVAFNVGLPLALGLITGDVWGMLLMAGLVRVVLVHHFTFCINSLAHMFGSQRWSTGNSSRDSWWLSFFTFGEGYHNYHHAFETDYRNGVEWYHFDPGKWLIWSLTRLNLASDVRRVPRDVVIRKRFEERREEVGSWWNAWQEKVEQWGEEASAMSDEMRRKGEALRLRLSEQAQVCETRLEEQLAEFQAARKALQIARRERATLASDQRPSVRHLRELRSRMAKTRRDAESALREWERAMGECFKLAVA
jgi:stearoyl-CoA desaturase (delta-9 desaturase)